ncbi:hypothetical protein OXYTRIMIC_204 [Oxytricha trifallax]|uniref:Uncharacterized protein n=1 Tax=Oxytricha trifallax TaxID=1172189 RepID=A0A073HYJ0_9SPIT|nr:hypothetical protein OXYTRIMIC_204 [Oxytricha trifallax]
MELNKKGQLVYTEEFKKGVLDFRIKQSRDIIKNVFIDYARFRVKRKYYLDSVIQTLKIVQWEEKFANMSPQKVKRLRESLQEMIDIEVQRDATPWPFDNLIEIYQRKSLAEDIDRDSIIDIEHNIKSAQSCVISWEMGIDGGQKYIDNLIETMGILPSK